MPPDQLLKSSTPVSGEIPHSKADNTVPADQDLNNGQVKDPTARAANSCGHGYIGSPPAQATRAYGGPLNRAVTNPL